MSGNGTPGDAYHLTTSRPDGAGTVVAMKQALQMADLTPDDIDYVNARSTSKAAGDAAEIAALRAMFGHRGRSMLVSSTKSSTGHLLGAAGVGGGLFNHGTT